MNIKDTNFTTHISMFGSVNIPIDMCQSLGFTQGQRVSVTVEDGKIIVQAASKQHYFKRAANKVKETVSKAVKRDSTQKDIEANLKRQRQTLKKEPKAKKTFEWEESPTAI